MPENLSDNTAEIDVTPDELPDDDGGDNEDFYEDEDNENTSETITPDVVIVEEDQWQPNEIINGQPASAAQTAIADLNLQAQISQMQNQLTAIIERLTTLETAPQPTIQPVETQEATEGMEATGLSSLLTGRVDQENTELVVKPVKRSKNLLERLLM